MTIWGTACGGIGRESPPHLGRYTDCDRPLPARGRGGSADAMTAGWLRERGMEAFEAGGDADEGHESQNGHVSGDVAEIAAFQHDVAQEPEVMRKRV